MKRLLLILLLAFPCLSRAQGIPGQISSVDSLIYALIQTPTTPGSVTHGHEAYILYEIDSTLRALYTAIGASGNLQAVTALGNTTTITTYFGNATTGCQLNSTGFTYNAGGVNALQFPVGSVVDGQNVISIKDANSAFRGGFGASLLTAARQWRFPDEGNAGLPGTLVTHTTKDPITIGNIANQGTFHTIFGDWCYKSGIPFSYLGDDGAGAWEAILTSSTHGGTTTLHGDTAAGTLNQWFSLGSGTYAMLDDTAKGRNGLYIMTEHTYDSLVALAGFITPTSKSTLTNKRYTARDTSFTTATSVTFNTDRFDGGTISALASSITIGVSGTPTAKQSFVMEIWDNGSAQTLTFGASIVFGSSVTAPATTAGSTTKPLTIQLTALKDGKFHAEGVNQE